MKEIKEILGDLMIAADYGWFPPGRLPTLLLDRAKRRQSAQVDLDRYAAELVDARIRPIHDKALRKGIALETYEQVTWVTELEITPAMWQYFNPDDADSPRAMQALRARRAPPVIEKVGVKGTMYTPQVAVMEFFWVGLRLQVCHFSRVFTSLLGTCCA